MQQTECKTRLSTSPSFLFFSLLHFFLLPVTTSPPPPPPRSPLFFFHSVSCVSFPFPFSLVPIPFFDRSTVLQRGIRWLLVSYNRMEVAREWSRYKTQLTVTRRNAVGGNFANFAKLHEARHTAATDNDIDVDGTMITLRIPSRESMMDSVWSESKESSAAAREAHKGSFFRDRTGRSGRILSRKPKGEKAFIATRVIGGRKQVGLSRFVLYVPRTYCCI